MDSIEVSGIRAYGYTGLLAEERTLGQWFEVDLTIWLDLKPSADNDNLDDSVDYRHAISLTQHVIKTAKFALVEKLADVIAIDILKINLVQKVRVRLSKLAPPIPDFGGKVTIDITRSQ